MIIYHFSFGCFIHLNKKKELNLREKKINWIKWKTIETCVIPAKWTKRFQHIIHINSSFWLHLRFDSSLFGCASDICYLLLVWGFSVCKSIVIWFDFIEFLVMWLRFFFLLLLLRLLLLCFMLWPTMGCVQCQIK